MTGVDLTYGMARTATERLPGAIVLADGRRLPFPDGAFDAVTSVWLLHLLDGPGDVRTAVAECARVLRPGGAYVTTVDKAAAHDVGSDIDAVLAPRPRRPAGPRTPPKPSRRIRSPVDRTRSAGPASRASVRGAARAARSRTCDAAGSPGSRPATPGSNGSPRGWRPSPTRTDGAPIRSSGCWSSASPTEVHEPC